MQKSSPSPLPAFLMTPRFALVGAAKPLDRAISKTLPPDPTFLKRGASGGAFPPFSNFAKHPCCCQGNFSAFQACAVAPHGGRCDRHRRRVREGGRKRVAAPLPCVVRLMFLPHAGTSAASPNFAPDTSLSGELFCVPDARGRTSRGDPHGRRVREGGRKRAAVPLPCVVRLMFLPPAGTSAASPNYQP